MLIFSVLNAAIARKRLMKQTCINDASAMCICTFSIFLPATCTSRNRASVRKITTNIFPTTSSSDNTISIAVFNRIHRHRSWSVEAVSTILAKRVFMIPMSKNIFDMTGIEVIAMPMINTSKNAA